MYHSDLSVDSSIRTAKYRNGLWVEGETRRITYHGVSAKKRGKTLTSLFFLGGGEMTYLWIFALRGGLT